MSGWGSLSYVSPDDLISRDGLQVANHIESTKRAGAEPSRLPCLADNRRWLGCVGQSACTAPKCWRPQPNPLPGLEEIVLPERVPNRCKTCANVVDVEAVRLARSPHDSRLVGCGAKQWRGLVSMYNLLDRRVPLRGAAQPDCPDYVRALELRPEVQQRREADRLRSWARRASRRHDGA